ncbi:MAG: L-cysteine/cystine lyase [Solirubrobacteraceae bacterium]|nr:L-cysteine/cystine lyase [Solirubrobacteraceae bacterium]
MTSAALRAQFPILERVAYLNAGTDGPVPRAAQEAAARELESELAEGRAKAHFERRLALQDELRAGYAGLLGCEPGDVALSTSTSEGIGKVMAGMDFGPGDEIVTSDEEHPGLIGPLIAARQRGATIKAVPFPELADAVGPATTAVACSHVSWRTGMFAPAALAEAGVPVILDGAQGVGAVPVDVVKLGCAAYAGSGQKWLCGADGTGMLYVAPKFRDRIRAIAPAYTGFEDASRGLESELKADARRYDTPSLARESVAFSLAALNVLREADLAAVLTRGPALAATLAERLADHGRTVAPRGHSTLVSFEDEDPEATRDRLLDAGVLVRNLPGTPLVRVSVGAWSSEDDFERLLAAL